jgi:hypothetical protein
MAQESSTLEKYRAAQQTVRELEKPAKQELVERYQALMAEAAAIQKELKDTFGYRVKVPDHSTISRTRRLIAVETHQAVFQWVLRVLAESRLLKGNTIGVDATTLEANGGGM